MNRIDQEKYLSNGAERNESHTVSRALSISTPASTGERDRTARDIETLRDESEDRQESADEARTVKMLRKMAGGMPKFHLSERTLLKIQEQSRQKREWAAVRVLDEDIALVADELCVDKSEAEQWLRGNGGNVEKTFRSVIRSLKVDATVSQSTHEQGFKERL